MGESRIVQVSPAERAVQQQAMADLVEASKLPATFVNCFTLQEGGPNAVRFVFSDQFAQGFRPTPRTAVIMDLAMFRNMIESCNGVIRKLDEAAEHAKAAEEPKHAAPFPIDGASALN